MADYLKIPEVARRLDVSEKTARRYVKAGTIPSVFVGGAYRVSEEDLAKYLQGARVEPEVEAPKVQAPEPWRDELRALDKTQRRDLALTAKGFVSDTWLGATGPRETRALKAFTDRHGVGAEDVLEALVEESPGLEETLNALAERFLKESRRAVDEALEHGADAS